MTNTVTVFRGFNEIKKNIFIFINCLYLENIRFYITKIMVISNIFIMNITKFRGGDIKLYS